MKRRDAVTYQEAIVKCAKAYSDPAVQIPAKMMLAKTISYLFDKSMERVQADLATASQ